VRRPSVLAIVLAPQTSLVAGEAYLPERRP
jgi:hypothetical protein